MQKNKKQNSKVWKFSLAGLAVILVAAGVFLALRAWDEKKEENKKEIVTQTEKEQTGGADVPLEAEINEETGLAQVSVSISAAGSNDGVVYAGGQVNNSTDGTGLCTFIFTGPQGMERAIDTETLPSANSVVCAQAHISADEFGPGFWSVVLKYNSSYSEGESESVRFEVE